ncbi:MAG: hypothetical protein KA099_05960 [Alphaproteobacteria bacterium]|nr:hypothetical protein [Alphaproteobacteria bacterium]MBP7904853.1 hypothetical protein [Alphaproteobacteria bacterium]
MYNDTKFYFSPALKDHPVASCNSKSMGKAMPSSSTNWLESQLEEARKDYEKWPEWKKACSRTEEFKRDKKSSLKKNTESSLPGVHS